MERGRLISKKTWLTVSATEWAPYASMAALPEMKPATNLEMAIRKLATNAARTDRFVPRSSSLAPLFAAT